MSDGDREVMRPVFLEPRDDHWAIHDPADLSMDDQREYHPVPLATAGQLKNAFYCEDCFPRRSPEDYY